MFTRYHSKYLACELKKRLAADRAEKLAQSLSNATVDLNPHQSEAALFAFRSPLSRGAILADEVGLAVVLENDGDVLKWVRPSKGDFRIYYAQEDEYVPDFAVETKSTRYICEPKRNSEMTSDEVLAKARAAKLWCDRATSHAGGKPWKYLLIPHDAIDDSKTLAGLAATFEFHGE